MNWKKYKLGDVISLQRGHDLPQSEFIAGKYLVGGSNGPIGYHDNFTTKGPGVTLGRSGNSIGVAHYYKDDFWAHNTTLYVKDFKGNCPKFIYYLLKTIDFYSHNSGSAVPSLNRNYLYPFEILVPSIETQQRIAEILSSLDDKIELNKQMNQTLEEMAQAMFKHYFVNGIDKDNLPEGWRTGKLQEVCNVSIGRTPPRLEKEWFQNGNGDYKWISIKDIGQSGMFIFDTSECLSNEAVKRFNIPVISADTLILSFKLTVGRIAITTEPMLSNEAIAQLPLIGKTINKEFLYLYLKGFDYDTLGNTSSIATAVNSKTIKEMPILLPKASLVSEYGAKTSELFDLIKSNLIEINSLVEIRNYLLPKLMSGEIVPADLKQLENAI